jgi:hypothetical protein
MSTLKSRWDLSDVEISASATAAARVVQQLTRQRDDIEAQWTTAIRFAHANGASLCDVASVAGVAPQTISNICKE